MTTKVAVIGSGNIGTDLMIKVLRTSTTLEMAALVGIDPASDGLARAVRMGVPAVPNGVQGLMALHGFEDIALVFDATSASAHRRNDELLKHAPVRLIDLTPAAIGPFVVPSVNLEAHLTTRNLNMVTCGGQATVPVVAAITTVTPVHYAEIVASIASKSAGPGTRANIDAFTQTTSRALEAVGGAGRGKAIIVLNPAEPPLLMRDTVLAIVDDADRDAITASVGAMVARVAAYVPGYRLKQQVQFRDIRPRDPERTLTPGLPSAHRLVVTVCLEVEGAAHYLPSYAGRSRSRSRSRNRRRHRSRDARHSADLTHAHDLGVRSVRVATHCTEADIAVQHIAHARDLGIDVSGFLMMSHMVEPAALVGQAQIMEKVGADCVYVTDSGGRLTMDGYRSQIRAVRDALAPQTQIGVHAHHNLALGVANSVVGGGSPGRRLPRGAGSGGRELPHRGVRRCRGAQRLGVRLRPFALMDAADDLVRPRQDRPVRVDRETLTVGYAGVYSSFLRHAEAAATTHHLDARSILVEVGRRGMVGGQEDMILRVADDPI